MTISDDLHGKLANVTQALGEERTKYDNLRTRYDDLVDQLTQANYQNQDLIKRVRLLEEKLEDIRNAR